MFCSRPFIDYDTDCTCLCLFHVSFCLVQVEGVSVPSPFCCGGGGGGGLQYGKPDHGPKCLKSATLAAC